MMKVIVSWWWKWLYFNAHDINDDDQDAHTSIDGNAEDSDEKDSRKSNNINNIIHNKNAG